MLIFINLSTKTQTVVKRNGIAKSRFKELDLSSATRWETKVTNIEETKTSIIFEVANESFHNSTNYRVIAVFHKQPIFSEVEITFTTLISLN